MRIIKGEVYFPILIGAHLLLWAIDLLMFTGRLEPSRVAGEILASWVLTVLALNLLMTTRARWLERLFGGLDKMYTIHRRAAVVSVVLLVLHLVIVPKSAAFHAGKLLGIVAVVLLIIGVAVSAAPPLKRLIPYHRWLPMHKLMGIFFAVGVVHALLVSTLMSQLVLVRLYVYLVAAVGVGAWIYRTFLHRLVHRPLAFVIEQVRKLGSDTLEITMSRSAQPMDHHAGQFAFVAFPTSGSTEAHPFTISSGPSADRLRFSIKALGDYTNSLANQLEVGQPATVTGPYGQFTQEAIRGRRQIWMAGGIGITPFLALAAELEPDFEVDLWWTVETASDASYAEELERFQELNPSFRFHLWISSERGYLTADQAGTEETLSDADILVCGPAAMRDALIAQLRQKNVPARRIHFEEFSFR